MRYPAILSKKKEEIEHFFKVLEDHGISEQEIVHYLIEYPRLISFDMEKQIKEIGFMFNLYHGIKE